MKKLTNTSAQEKYEGITGEELPRRVKRMEKSEHLPYIKLRDLKVTHLGKDWGSRQNNPCELYITADGRYIEGYTAFTGGMEVLYIEVK